jgi:hypothetical protein
MLEWKLMPAIDQALARDAETPLASEKTSVGSA